MARRPLTFKQHDVTRALKAAIAADVEVVRVEITRDGNIAMTVTRSKAGSTNSRLTAEVNEWDAVQ
jgi:hypothetical protein